MFQCGNRIRSRTTWEARLRVSPSLEVLEGRAAPSSLSVDRLFAPLDSSAALAGAASAVWDDETPELPAAANRLSSVGAPALGGVNRPAEVFSHLDAFPQTFAAPAGTPDARSVGYAGKGRVTSQDDGDPVITDFRAIEEGDGWWTFEGTVSASSMFGMVVQFGGLPALAGQAAEVDPNDGTFHISLQFPDCQEGLVTARAVDWQGRASEVAMEFVHQTTCEIGSSGPHR